jgi:hypothetical protein
MEMKTVKRIAGSLKESREDFEPHFEQLEKNFMPRRGAFSTDPAGKEKSNRGKMINSSILDSTPILARRTLQSGLQAGVSSPSRPWFRLQPLDPDRRERTSVKLYLAKAEYEMRRLMDRSGLYNMLHTGYGDLGVYGAEVAIIENKGETDLRGIELVPGSYWIGMSDDETVDTLYREFGMTINQIVGKFVYKGRRYGDPDWSIVPTRLKEMYDKGDIAKTEVVSQLITPRRDRDPTRSDKANKPIASNYWLKDDDHSVGARGVLSDDGYDENPISASRWNAVGYEPWGYSPAMDALPDVKELMAKRRDYAELLRRLNRPPMNAHSDLRNSKFSLLPNAVNFMADPSKGLVPAYQVNPQLGPLAEDIQMSKNAVWSAMYGDLFMMISQLDRRQITATEIDERREEKLIALGPVLERLHHEKLRPLVQRLFMRVLRSGVLGDPPEELRDQDIEVDFVSMLAQAQKAVATGSMERLAGFVGNLSAVLPDVLDKFDADQSVDEYADMLGTPPGVVRSDDAVAELRKARQQKIDAAEALEAAGSMAQTAQHGAQAAKVMSEADDPRGAAPGDVLAKLGLG